jgi:cysteine desulfurase
MPVDRTSKLNRLAAVQRTGGFVSDDAYPYNHRYMPPIYLDFNSTAPQLAEVTAAIRKAEATNYANPASQHAEGRRAHAALENAREEIARLLGANLTDRTPDRLIFTSGGTEANNLALLGLIGGIDHQSRGRLIISAIEHPSVTSVANYLVRQGWQIERLRVNSDGVVCLDHLDELLAAESTFGPVRLVSVMTANNETGVLQPIEEIVHRCEAVGVPVHADAVQAAGKIPIRFRHLGVSAMTVAAHKLGGPRGIGALLVRQHAQLAPILHGATQQLGERPGTESVVLPIGFLAALKAWEQNRASWVSRIDSLRNRFESAVCDFFPGAIINGKNAPRLPNTSNIAFVGHDRQALFMALDLAGICCSTGSACASGSSEPSPTLLAMKLPKNVIESSLRFSMGTATTADEIYEALQRIKSVLSRLAT